MVVCSPASWFQGSLSRSDVLLHQEHPPYPASRPPRPEPRLQQLQAGTAMLVSHYTAFSMTKKPAAKLVHQISCMVQFAGPLYGCEKSLAVVGTTIEGYSRVCFLYLQVVAAETAATPADSHVSIFITRPRPSRLSACGRGNMASTAA